METLSVWAGRFQGKISKDGDFWQDLRNNQELNKDKCFSNKSRFRRVLQAELSAGSFLGGIFSEDGIVWGFICGEFVRGKISMQEVSIDGGGRFLGINEKNIRN